MSRHKATPQQVMRVLRFSLLRGRVGCPFKPFLSSLSLAYITFHHRCHYLHMLLIISFSLFLSFVFSKNISCTHLRIVGWAKRLLVRDSTTFEHRPTRRSHTWSIRCWNRQEFKRKKNDVRRGVRKNVAVTDTAPALQALPLLYALSLFLFLSLSLSQSLFFSLNLSHFLSLFFSLVSFSSLFYLSFSSMNFSLSLSDSAFSACNPLHHLLICL